MPNSHADCSDLSSGFRTVLAVVVVATAVTLAACGPPALLKGPETAAMPSGGGGKYQCTSITGKTDPWLVEWDATHVARMQAAAQEGVLLVHYSGCELEILYGCEQEGAYKFVPTTLSTNTEYITNEDEIFAKLPVGALKLVGEFQQGDKWSLDYAITGMKQTAVKKIDGAALEGGCDRATHFVSAMAVGAYRLVSEAKRNAAASVEVFGSGAGVSGGRSAGALRQAGVYEECISKLRSKDPDCQAVVQLFLSPVEAAPPPSVPSVATGVIASMTSSTPMGTGYALPPLPPQMDDQHTIHLSVEPVGAAVALDNRDGWHPAPHSFPAAPGKHRLEIKRLGFQTEALVVTVSASDVTVSVEMNRPVFEAGVGLGIVGAIFTVAGVALLGAGGTNECDNNVEGGADLMCGLGAGIGGIGLPLAISGLLMMLLDGHDDAQISINPVAAL